LVTTVDLADFQIDAGNVRAAVEHLFVVRRTRLRIYG
jgi:hypothetical protein